MATPSSTSETPMSPTTEKAVLSSELERVKRDHASRLDEITARYYARRQVLLASLRDLDEETTKAADKTKDSLNEETEKLMKRMKLVEDRHKVRKGAAVFSRLPAEVLGFIFDEYVNGGDSWADRGSPWTLVLVNRFWYATAMGTPRLWRTIMITNSLLGFWNSRKSRDTTSSVYLDETVLAYPSMLSPTQVCRSLDQLNSVLVRSGVAPLHIIIAFRDSEVGDGVAPVKVVQLYHRLFTPPVCHRIDHLELDSSMMRYALSWFSFRYTPPHPATPSTSSSSSIALSDSGGGQQNTTTDDMPHASVFGQPTAVAEEQLLSYADIFKGPLSNLRSLTLHDPSISENWPILKLVIEAASTTLEGVHVTLHSVLQRLAEQSFWSQLKSIQTSSSHVLNSVLSRNVALEQLLIDGTKTKWKSHGDVPNPWPDRRTPNINFTHLTNLAIVIDDFSTLSRLTFPVLQSLEITAGLKYHNGFSSSNFHMISSNNAEIAANYAHPDFLVPLPALKSLTVRSPHCAPLGRFDMPVLETLRLTSECQPKLKCDKDLEPLFPNAGKKTRKRREGEAGGEGGGGEGEEDEEEVDEYDPVLNPNGAGGGTTNTTTTTDTGNPPPPHLKTIRHFYFTADLTDLTILRILRLLPALHTLYLTPTKKIGIKIFEALASGKVVSRQRMPLAPELSVLRIDCSGGDEEKRRKVNRRKSKSTTTAANANANANMAETTAPGDATATAAEASNGGGGEAGAEDVQMGGAKTADGFVKMVTRVASSRRMYWKPLERCEVVWVGGEVQSF